MYVYMYIYIYTVYILYTHLHAHVHIYTYINRYHMSEKLYIYCLAVTGCCFPSLQDGKFVTELKEAADVLLASLIRIISGKQDPNPFGTVTSLAVSNTFI